MYTPAYTLCRHNGQWRGAEDEPDEISIAINNFLDTLGDLALPIASRKASQGQRQDGEVRECEP